MSNIKKIKATCQFCEKSFYADEYYVKKGMGKFCSRSCYLSSRWKQNGICKYCGKPSDTRFCSTECQRSFWNKNDWALRKKNKFWEQKKQLIKQLGGKCIECGINDFRVLEIHHIDKSLKVWPKDRTWNWLRRFQDWKSQTENLELLCANCHRIHTWAQLDYGSDISDKIKTIQSHIAPSSGPSLP